uniref:F5/8 type C domain-containing protein n=1 Tax=Chromera velia CCMP2878 TaxID=1169474 RepID=A0A0G4GRL1_9ALVE|eukprot:Cvel_23000.t1-p1 / transcript=Cvel_23000.t1 / gene=Cvel_23000 / organism=Chromera_velia_CCMP2878 / gene_product=hypothetical protein / transcript_product=hypothetical protein / location=Cvel_scaffold2321:11012-13527(+) / protein_length=283 / sequence_SO=supercontig / SO=protein_coding / is_pseudo=false
MVSEGDLVSFAGLENSSFNHHVGRVQKLLSNGRVAVELHAGVWEEEGVRKGATRKRMLKAGDKVISLKRENLRKVWIHQNTGKGKETDADALSTFGSLPPKVLLRILRLHSVFDQIAHVIVEFLSIVAVNPDQIEATRCSSTSHHFPLSEALTPDTETWWISGSHRMVGGLGEEFVEVFLSEIPKRVSFFGLRIPPLPVGPLSVRRFHLLVSTERRCDDKQAECEWMRIPVSHESSFETLDRGDLQVFVLNPPVEATRVRVVCTENAARGIHECVGFFEARFR